MTKIRLTGKFPIEANVVNWTINYDEPYHIVAECAGDKIALRFNSPKKLKEFIDYKTKAFATDLYTNKQYLVEWISKQK